MIDRQLGCGQHTLFATWISASLRYQISSVVASRTNSADSAGIGVRQPGCGHTIGNRACGFSVELVRKVWRQLRQRPCWQGMTRPMSREETEGEGPEKLVRIEGVMDDRRLAEVVSVDVDEAATTEVPDPENPDEETGILC